MSFISDLFGGGGKDIPPPVSAKPSPVRVEPGKKLPKKKNLRSLATQLELSEPLIKEEKLGT